MRKKSKQKKEVIKERIANRRGERNTERKNHQYIAWNHLTRNEKEVAKRVLAGKYKHLQPGSWGFLDRFFIFLKSIGFFLTLDVDGKGFQRKMITIAKLLLTYNVKVLLGIRSINQVPDLLFGDIGLLMLIGYTAEQIKNGFCKRGGGKRKGPMHKNTLGDSLHRFSPKEVEHILNEGVKILAKQGFIKDKIYILDATDIETTKKCKGHGVKKITKEGVKVEIEKTIYGFKLIIIRTLESRIVVAAKVVKIQEHEEKFMLPLLKKAQENIGKNRIRLLLIDRGFIDGIDLWKVKHIFHIDFIIPAKTDMRITGDARGYRLMRESDELHWAEDKDKGIRVVGIKGLRSYDQYGDEAHNKKNFFSKSFRGNPLNVVMVTKWDGEVYPRGKEKVFLTTLSVSKPLEIIEKYSLRSLIENTAFRELKQGWHLGAIPKKTRNAVTAHIFLTLCMYNMTNAYRTDLGEELTGKGIRRYRIETFKETRQKLVIIAGEYYGIFDLEEYAILVGNPPEVFWDVDPEKVRQKYGL